MKIHNIVIIIIILDLVSVSQIETMDVINDTMLSGKNLLAYN